MVKFLVKRPVAVFMATFAFLLLGIVSSMNIPTALVPDIAIPEITVQINHPNNTARELETNVIRPLRNQLLQISNLKDIKSETRDGFSSIKLVFEYGTNTDYAFIETNEKIDASLNYLPRDVERPKVIKASATDIPIFNLTISLKEGFSEKRFLELSEFSEVVLKKRIEQLEDIALADISGQSKAEIVIIPFKNKIQSLGITNNDLVDAIKQNNFELGNLLVQNGVYQYNFKFANPLASREDIENIYLNINDKLFQLKDLSEIILQAQKEQGLVYNNGKRSIVLAIIKQSDARVYDLMDSLGEVADSFIEEYPEIEFSINQDQTKLLKLSIDNLKSSLWIGSILAILIMFFFLKDIKSPLIIAISIPTSLIISLLLLYSFDLSINIISLSGLILGVGMMIDNSIIVIDNITQKIESGLSILDSCVKGTNEIISPLISSVLTTCSVFLPLIFLSGITGALFYDQALAVSIGLGSSLIVSIVLIPVLYKQLKNKKLIIEKWLRLDLKTQNIESLYEKGYSLFFYRKWIVYGISIISVFLAVILFVTMEYRQLPEFTQSETILSLDWNENITVNENQRRISELLHDITGVETEFSIIGEQQFILQKDNIRSPEEASVYIKSDNPISLINTKKEITKKLKNEYFGTSFKFSSPKSIFEYLFGKSEGDLIAQVYSRNSLEVPKEESYNSIKELVADKTDTKAPLKLSLSIQILHENVLLYDVNYKDLINELKTAFNENFIDDLKTAQEFVPIKLNYDIKDFDQTIKGLFVANKEKELIPVQELVKVNNVYRYKSITSNRNGEYLHFDIETNGSMPSEIQKLKNRFKNNNYYNIRFAGNWLELKDLKEELIFVIVIAILLLYFIMAAQFESLWQPFIVLLEIPIDVGGALLLLWLFDETINVMAVIGIVVMSGVIINDSILKLHTINMFRKEGLGIEEAIKQGGKLRLKPILMTSLTTILALLPFLFIEGLGAELQKPLALTVIGGMFIGTFISLYFIPLMYSFLSKKDVYAE